MLDAREYFRLWLLSLEGLGALSGDRVYCDPLPKETPFPSVSYFCKSLPEGEGVPLQNVTATVWCWGRTEEESRRVYGALVSALLSPGAETARVGGQVLSGLSLEGEEKTDQDLELHLAWVTQCTVVFAMAA